MIAGGGLSLLYAPLLAAEGHRVAVVERARAGAAHREWNASRQELAALSRVGIASAREIDEELVVARYRHGVCRWFGGHEHVVRGVLDCAVDAGTLLRKARALAEARGVTFLDGTSVVDHAATNDAVTIAIETGAVRREIVARVLVDARGAASPFATADIVCPTVGGVVSGLEEGEGATRVRPDVGEILATTEGVEETTGARASGARARSSSSTRGSSRGWSATRSARPVSCGRPSGSSRDGRGSDRPPPPTIPG